MKRIVVAGAFVDIVLFFMFKSFRLETLAWQNVISIGMYVVAYVLLARRINGPALVLVWLEVLVHSTIGTLELGWSSGCHYYQLLFIPGIAITSSRRRAIPLIAALLVLYLALNAASAKVMPPPHLPTYALMTLNWFNISIVFALAFWSARFYRRYVTNAEDYLRSLATRDSLTGLSNRRHIRAIAKRAVMRCALAQKPLSVVIGDVDLFKRINDVYGHEVGDRVLVAIGQCLRRTFRVNDVASRWGGEEFLVLLPGADVHSAQRTVERVREAVAHECVRHDDGEVRFTMSFGIAQLDADESFDHAIARADAALYQSKSRGRNCVTLS